MEYANYEEWHAKATPIDSRMATFSWSLNDSNSTFDYHVIQRRYDELRELRNSNDIHELMFFYDEGIHGNMGGMGAPGIYRRRGSRRLELISDYITELSEGLNQLAETDALSLEEKLHFFRRAERAFGRCALMLSGAGSLGPFHIGTARALHEHRLLPSVISGASAGSIVAGILCTHSDEELDQKLDLDALHATFVELHNLQAENQAATNTRDVAKRQQINKSGVAGIIEHWIPDMTFGEALEHSGRHLAVSVAPSALHQQSRTLNPVISRNAMLREAILASCAVPGFIPPVTLAARGADGKRRAYVKSRTWMDGSISNDMPASRLRRIYGCNFYISSQTNPVVVWALHDPNDSGLLSQGMNIYQTAAKEWAKAWYRPTMQLVRNVYPLNLMTRMWYSLIMQDYTADVNIMPRQRFFDPTKLLANIPASESFELVREGERATWPHIERIRNCTLLGRNLIRIVRQLEAELEAKAS